jgi:phage baseplate assembly protein W
MAYGLRNINVLDLKPSVGVGVQLPFSTAGVFQTVYTTQEQLKYNIINYLLTNPRERIFNPSFGAGIREAVFQQLTTETLDILENKIRTGIAQHFPNVVIKKLTFGGNARENELIVNFSYLINNTGQTDNITLNLNG